MSPLFREGWYVGTLHITNIRTSSIRMIFVTQCESTLIHIQVFLLIIRNRPSVVRYHPRASPSFQTLSVQMASVPCILFVHNLSLHIVHRLVV